MTFSKETKNYKKVRRCFQKLTSCATSVEVKNTLKDVFHSKKKGNDPRKQKKRAPRMEQRIAKFRKRFVDIT
ncbi:hypothetical protein PsorP6_015346 [Peronosclerospora sorghi]|uniref:Uncharacterized protein n=1 Tax=Peronosclerospora sorghi TaxID=230839 RepID=A0ACC0VTP5_9STRA|nr:hypothetical protein PsorP6_015346 [Peronosclerospora sorghi]